MSQTLKADVAIIGAGIQGCSSAYHLAKRGLKVVVLERHWVARHASGVNAGGVRLLGRHISEVPLSLSAMQRWQTLDNELDGDTGFRRRSVINVAVNQADLDTLAARAEQMKALGYQHELALDEKALRERLPQIAEHCVGGVVSELDGYAIPYSSTQAFRIAAERLGAHFYSGQQVEAIRQRGEAWQLETPTMKIDSQYLINCAGGWADQVAVKLGDNCPMSFSAPMLMITTRVERFLMPVVGAVSRPLSLKQFDNGTVLIGGGAKGFANRESMKTELDYSKMATSARTVTEFFPIMKRASVNRMWAGIEAYMPDNLPVIGPSIASRNAFHAFGFSAHGFQLGPVIGDIMAQLICDGQSQFDLNAFRINRFERTVL